MDELEEKLLSTVTVNYLFLAQFETFRVSLQNLRYKNPRIAIAILQAIIERVGNLQGISWSKSVNDPFQLTWLSFGELLDCTTSLQTEKMEELLWRLHPGSVRHDIEFLYLVQTISNLIAAEADRLAKNNYENLWQWGASDFPGFEEDELATSLTELRDSEAVSSVVVVKDDTDMVADEVQEETTRDRVEACKRSGTLIFEGLSDIWRRRLSLNIFMAIKRNRKELDQDLAFEPSSSEAFLELVDACGSLKSILLERRDFLTKISTFQPTLLDALCWNIAKQKQLAGSKAGQNDYAHIESSLNESNVFPPDPGEKACFGTEDSMKFGVKGEPHSGMLDLESATLDLASAFQQEIQFLHLNAIEKGLEKGGISKVLHHIRFLHDNFGIDELVYIKVIKGVVQNIMTHDDTLSGQERIRTTMVMLYEQAIASKSMCLPSFVESAQDLLRKEEAEEYKISNEKVFPPALDRLHKRLQCLRAQGAYTPEAEGRAVSYCTRELYHYARTAKLHMLESVMDASLSAIKISHFQTAVDVLTLFPRLQPLVAVMGWDLLAGNTGARLKMMELLWSRKLLDVSSHVKHADEVVCIDHLCDQLCYHLELAYFAAYVNSGLEWDINNSRLFSNSKVKNTVQSAVIEEPVDPFVANLVLERLAMHSPIRVLFDVVPDVKLKHALVLLKMQPVSSPIAELHRKQDLELLHLHYGIQASAIAIGAMQRTMTESRSNDSIRLSMVVLQKLLENLEAISNPARRLWLMSIVVALLHMDDILGQTLPDLLESKADLLVENMRETKNVSVGEKQDIVGFIGSILGILRRCIPSPGLELDDKMIKHVPSKGSTYHVGFPGRSGQEAWEWMVTIIQKFIDDWEWRLAVLQRLSPSPQREWNWKEALAVLRAAPSTLLNLCVQKAQYELGEEAVLRFALSPEDEAALKLAEWVDGAVARASVDDVVSRVAEGASSHNDALNLIAFPLAPLPSVLLCVDVAAASARSVDMSRQLLVRARSLLADIAPAGSQRQGVIQIEQVLEACIYVVAKRVIQCLQELLDQEMHKTLQTLLSGADMINTSIDMSRQGHRQRALAILHQTIEDGHHGKRQFLSGKLHNLVKALADDEADEPNSRSSSFHTEKKPSQPNELGFLLGCGFRVSSKALSNTPIAGEHTGETTFFPLKGTGKRFLGPLSTKPSAYLSAFILYIATIGDIVDGVDTTHDFNFFSLIYERPNDLLTRLVFERGSAVAAGKIADIMGADLVHQVISACVPPVYPPMSGKDWACIGGRHSRFVQHSDGQRDSNLKASPFSDSRIELYPLKLDVVKHLATLSPVRAILCCMFGTRNVKRNNKDGNVQSSAVIQVDTDQSFYEFALEQSDRFPTLNRWVQMQANLQRLSDIPITSARETYLNHVKDVNTRGCLKRAREEESDTESEEEEIVPVVQASYSWKEQQVASQNAETVSRLSLVGSQNQLVDTNALELNYDNEGPYAEAVWRLIEEDKLLDALAVADRYLRDGAPDDLLQLLIERGDGDNDSQHTSWSRNWQYCIRLRNKWLAATLALKYLKNWDLESAINVLTMCGCHLPSTDPLHAEVLRVKKTLQQYSRILRADGRFTSWKEVENLCQKDPEGLALRLAAKGAVTTALDVADTFRLHDELRQELQGRQLVILLTSDPTTGGGPVEALRFLLSLPRSQDALPVAMAAMRQLPTLQLKQLLVQFFLKKRLGQLSDEELARLHKLALGLQMLEALPLPWQQRCSSLHQHPHLILETLLMWKQLEAASQLLQAYPALRGDSVILLYAGKAVQARAHYYEWRQSLPSGKPSIHVVPSTRPSLSSGITNLQREARRAFSWTSKDSGNKTVTKESSRKRKSTALPSSSQKAAWEAMARINEERPLGISPDGFERFASVTITEGWVLTGDPVKDESVRNSHYYESAPSITLFKALLSLCSSDVVSAKAAVELSIREMKRALRSEQLTPNASPEIVEQTFYATEVFVQALHYAKSQLRKLLSGSEDLKGEKGKNQTDDIVPCQDNSVTITSDSKLSESDREDLTALLSEADTWLNHAELLQNLFGAGIIATVDDFLEKESTENLRNRLIKEERYNMAVYACTKCKINAFPVWKAWAHALIQVEHYGDARIKIKQALQLHKGDPATIIRDIISTIEASPPVDVSSIRSLYIHMAKSASTILDDSLSADSYLNVLYMPSFTKSERPRRPSEDSGDGFSAFSSQGNGEDGPRSNLDSVRYGECVYYLQEFARQDLLSFMFKHGHYADACLLFFPPKSVPPSPLPYSYSTQTPSSSPQRPDLLATDFGTIDDLCELCVIYGAMPVLARVIASRGLSSNNQDPLVSQHTSAALARICTYCENHKHFNHLYHFQVLKKDHVAAGLCCIQLFLNSSNQEQALRHLEHAKMHFDEGLLTRQAGDLPKSSAKATRGKSASERFTEEELVKFSTRIAIQMDVVRCFSDAEGFPWKHSLFGNPNEADTLKRRFEVAEGLVERNFDLAFRIIYEFGLPAVNIYAAVAASLAERKKNNQVTDLLKNIKATISDRDLDEVITAAIMVFATKHRERPDRLIEMLSSVHRKVLACVVCGRLKSAFQIASRANNVADVQYVAHQARQTGALAVEDMCKQWLSRHL